MTRMIQNLKSQISNLKCKRPRCGFTLVEVLVVIAIIGMLVGLLVPAINAARLSGRRAVIKAEMTQLTNAIESFRTSLGGGQYPPDGTNLQDWQQFFTLAWPRTNWYVATPGSNPQAGQLPIPACFAMPPPLGGPNGIGPDTALAFWLGGAQDSSGAYIGFSANPLNPLDSASYKDSSGAVHPTRSQPEPERPRSSSLARALTQPASNRPLRLAISPPLPFQRATRTRSTGRCTSTTRLAARTLRWRAARPICTLRPWQGCMAR